MATMRYHPPAASLFAGNRARLRACLPPGAMVVVHANDHMPTNADGLMPFRQNSNFYHLSGIDQQASILLLFPSAADTAWQEILFLRATTPEVAVWEGEQLSAEGARRLSAIETIKPLADFEKIFFQSMCQADTLYLESNEHYRAEEVVQTRNARFIAACQKKYPLHQYRRLAPLMAQLRAVKSPEEVAQIQRACEITAAGFAATLRTIAPGRKEYEIEAACLQAFVSRGSRGFAYAPIVASGANACVLHYVDNAAVCKKEDLLLMDVGT